MHEDKREHPRIRISFPVRCEDLTSHRPFYTVFKDISVGGIKLISEQFLAVNKFLKVEINLINSIVRGRAKIVWCNNQPYSERYLVGIKFTEMDTHTKLALSSFLSNITPS